MTLRPLSSFADFELAAAWLRRNENSQWLGFGRSRQGITPTLLRIMVQREANFLRLYTSDADDTPIGIVALTNIDRKMRTGTFWIVAGDKSFRSRGRGRIAASRFLALAFRDLGLHTVNTWIVEHNVTRRGAEQLGFRFIGRQRQCHFIDGQPYDRLLFDLLAGALPEIEHPDRAAVGGRPDVGATVP